MARVVVVGVIGPPELTQIVVGKLSGAGRPEAACALPPGLASPFAGLDQLRALYSPAARTLFLQLAAPPSLVDTCAAEQAAGPAEGLQERLHGAVSHATAEFFKATLHLCLSCHLLLWAQPGTALDAGFLSQLQLLKAAKDKLLASGKPLPLPLLGPGNGRPSHPQLLIAFTADSLEAGLPAALEAQVREACSLAAAGRGGQPLLEPDPQQCVFALPHAGSYRQAVLDAALHGLGQAPTLPAVAGDAAFGSLREAALAAVQAAQQASGGKPCFLPDWCVKARQLRTLLGLQPMRQPPQQLSEPQLATEAAAAVKLLSARLTVGRRLSARKCASALQAGQAAYAADLPARYTAEQHEAALARALAAFRQQARGPEAGTYERRVREACAAQWEGRQACGAVSLTGRPCRLPPHGSDSGAGPAATEHESGVVHCPADVSGAARGELPDPFLPGAANAGPQPREAGTDVSLKRLALRLSCSGGSQPGGSCSCEWAWLATHASPTAAAEHAGAWAEGFDPSAAHLFPLALPRAPAGAAEPEPAERLDLDFPPLLAAAEPQGRDSAGDGAHQRAAAHQELLRAGWPGQTWPEPPPQALVRRGVRGPRDGRGRGRGLQAEDPPPRLLAGAEYESLQGTRVFLQPDMLPGSSSPSKGGNLAWLLAADLPLWLQRPGSADGVASAKAGEESEWLQLRRLWLVPPAAPLSFSSQPLVRFTAGEQQLEFQLEAAAVLAPGALTVLCLPLCCAFPSAWAADAGPTVEHSPCAADAAWRILQRSERACLVAGSACFPS